MIHKFHLLDNYIVLDICSGSVHIVDGLAFSLLDYINEKPEKKCPEKALVELNSSFTEDEINEAYNEIYDLYKNGILYSEDDYLQFKNKIVPAPIKAMCLHVAHDCNLKCEYCFAAKGDFGHGRTLMTEETGRKAIDYLIKNSGSRRNLEVDFFGGEPLMAFDTVKETATYAKSIENVHNKKFRFTITTNGLLLDDDIIEYINREMDNVVLSIDGRKKVNDRLRKTNGGQGSYDIIMPKYKKLVRSRDYENYYVRGTFTKHNLDFSKDVFHLYKQGFDQISIEPVVSDERLDYSIKTEDINDVCNEYEYLARKISEIKKAEQEISFFHFNVDLDGGPCAIKRLRGCSAGNEYIAVTPEGDIYPCHQFVGIDGYKMGSIFNNDFDDEMKLMFLKSNIFYKNECMKCWARFFCSGGCAANSLQYAGDIFGVYKLSCELEKKRIECAIAIQCAL